MIKFTRPAIFATALLLAAAPAFATTPAAPAQGAGTTRSGDTAAPAGQTRAATTPERTQGAAPSAAVQRPAQPGSTTPAPVRTN
jgi:hypothetical protein